MIKTSWLGILLAGTLLTATVWAQEPAPPEDGAAEDGAAENAGEPAADSEDAIHDALRALRDEIGEAVNQHDVEGILKHLHPNVVVTWPDGQVSRRHEGVRSYLDGLLSGADRVLENFTTDLTVDELTILYGGDTGVAFGSSNDHYELTGGDKLDMTARWCATLVQEDGRWLIASFTGSTNPFDNPILANLKGWTLRVGVGGLLVGLIVGFVVGRVGKRS